VLENNFDRLRVLSVTAEVSVDSDESASASDFSLRDSRPAGKDQELEVADQPGVATPSRRIGTAHPSKHHCYAEAAGDARLAWRWAEGWRARLRKAGNLVEQARWEEWRLDRQSRSLPKMVPVVHEAQVVAPAPEVAEGCQGVVDTTSASTPSSNSTAMARRLRRKRGFWSLAY
jgi:hypothetical protein